MHEWISLLENALKNPLPAAQAHSLMSPAGRGNTEEYILTLKSPARISAVMILIYPDGGQYRIVLIKRPDYKGIHSGQISFPGGKAEAFDASYLQTAFRETHEEIGVGEAQIHLVGALSRIYIPPSNFLVYPFVGFCETVPVFKTDPIEVERLILPPINVLMDETIRKEGIFTSGGEDGWQIQAPYYEIENEKVWGATAAILSEFKAVISSIKAE
jgi:8-oxo-dGTP pyrophosphatase MutT (NUDIX family)